MNQKSIDKLKEEVVKSWKNHGDNRVLVSGFNSYTGNEIAKEIEDETDFGIDTFNNIILLTIDLIKRNKV